MIREDRVQGGSTHLLPPSSGDSGRGRGAPADRAKTAFPRSPEPTSYCQGRSWAQECHGDGRCQPSPPRGLHWAMAGQPARQAPWSHPKCTGSRGAWAWCAAASREKGWCPAPGAALSAPKVSPMKFGSGVFRIGQGPGGPGWPLWLSEAAEGPRAVSPPLLLSLCDDAASRHTAGAGTCPGPPGLQHRAKPSQQGLSWP